MDREAALDTYRYLRGGVPVMLIMLAVAIVIEVVRSHTVLTSVSAYYFTSVHAVFIGSICVMGALLIVYRGVKPTEDVLLNLAGTLAFVVAFVPTTRPSPDVPVGLMPDQTVIANVWAMAVALVVARIASWVMYRRTHTTPDLGPIAKAAMWLQRLVFTVGLVTLAAAPRWFVANAHGIAAVTLFAAIIATVVLTAFVADKGVVDSANPARYQRIYKWVAVAMVCTLVAAVVVHFAVSQFSHVVIVVEVVLLAEFFVYWAVQTVEKWNPPPSDTEQRTCTAGEERVLNAL
jgi:hypothetical protein